MPDRKQGTKQLVQRAAFLGLALCLATAQAAPGSGWGKNRDSGGTSDASPYLSFSADPATVALGEKALLTWAGLNVRKCSASGDWEGSKPTEGYYQTAPIDGPKTYTLKCNKRGGSVEKTLVVSVIEPPEEPVPTTPPEPEPAPTPPPEPEPVPVVVPVVVSLSAAPMEIVSGETAMLSWSSSGADSCSGSPNLGDNLPPSGSHTSGALSSDTSFTMTCSGSGGSDSQTVMISVLPPPPASNLQLSSSSPTARAGESITLSWSGTSVSNCQASGAWSGPKDATGTETIDSLQTDGSFTLSCDGTEGKLVAMTSVLVSEGGKLLSWQPPQLNEDGSPINDLDAYRIYVGLSSRNYGQPVELTDTTTSSYFLELLPGDYYISMTAVDIDDNESAFSNEVLTSVN
jgi:hypothetical protein